MNTISRKTFVCYIVGSADDSRYSNFISWQRSSSTELSLSLLLVFNTLENLEDLPLKFSYDLEMLTIDFLWSGPFEFPYKLGTLELNLLSILLPLFYKLFVLNYCTAILLLSLPTLMLTSMSGFEAFLVFETWRIS